MNITTSISPTRFRTARDFLKFLISPFPAIPILTLSILLSYFGVWRLYFSSDDDFHWAGLLINRGNFFEAVKGLDLSTDFLDMAKVWLETKLFYLNAAPYLWVSLIQHAIVTFIVYWLVRFWTRKDSIAFLAALLFATAYSHLEVVTSIAASISYSWWAIIYLLILLLFSFYINNSKSVFLIGSVTLYVILSLGNDFALTLPLVLLAYHFTLGNASIHNWKIIWRNLRVHTPFWVIWFIHVVVQGYYVLLGSSEATNAIYEYGPGLHIFSNLHYLVFHIFPNVHLDPIYNYLSNYLNPQLVEMIWISSIVIAVLCGLLAIFGLWKGTPLIRFSIALIILPFLPYLLWEGDFAEAPRYLYVSSVGYCFLLALLIQTFYEKLRSHGRFIFRILPPGIIIIYLTFNVLILQVWVHQQIGNAQVRRPFITQLAAQYQGIEDNALVFIEVPERGFLDLRSSCQLVFRRPISCRAFITGTPLPAELTQKLSDRPIYWLRLADTGLVQIRPASPSVP